MAMAKDPSMETYRSEEDDEDMTMQACYYSKYGKPSVLHLGTLPRARLLTPNDVLIRVHAASISPIDYKRREGAFKLILNSKWPTIIGYDVAGTIVLCGADVKNFRAGDEVYACAPHDRDGTLAEFVAIPGSAVALKPKNLSFVQAAAVPISALVAMQTLRRINLQAGQNLLLTGGSGGVGTFALQLAKHVFKAGRIATTALQQKEHIITRLGADIIVDYTDSHFEKEIRNYDCAMDCTSEAKKCVDCVKSGGIVASIADTPPPEAVDDLQGDLNRRTSCCLGIALGCLSYSMRSKARAKKIEYAYVLVAPDGEMLGELSSYFEEGVIRPVIDKVFPFAQALEAMELLEGGHVTGKIVIEMPINAAQPESDMTSVHPASPTTPLPGNGTPRTNMTSLPHVKERRLSHVNIVKMGKSTKRLSATSVPVMLNNSDGMEADITEELRNNAPNIGRDVIAISTTATPMQVSMSPQEEMLNHTHLQKAMKNRATLRDVEILNKDVRGWLRRHTFTIHPHGKVRLRWDVFCILLIFFNAFIIPYQVAYEKSNEDSMINSAVDYLIDFFFALDMIANFFTGVDIKGKVFFDFKTISKQYIKTWFFIDLFSIFPFTFLIQSNNPQLGKVLKMIRLARLLRLFRMIRILNRLQHALLIRSTISSLFRYCLTVIFISHWFACFFFWVSFQDSTTIDPPVNTWLKEKNLLDAPVADQYVTALYWAIMTLATVGYGDVSAISTNERLFAIFAMFAGAGIFAYGITNIVALVSSLTAHETAFREKMDEINEYMAARDLPRQLRVEIREFFQNARKSKENDMVQEQELLNELSAMLRSKIALAINDHFLWKFPFFKGSDPNFIMDLALSMRMICFAPFEDVCVEGELGHEMFFIFRGAVEVLKDGLQLTVLGENQYFGEMAILNKDCKRMATVRTLCFCELRMLSRVRFLEALVHFPKMMQKLANYSKARAQAKTNGGGPSSFVRRESEEDVNKTERKTSKPKNPAYRLNWKGSIDNEGASGFGSENGIGTEAVLQLDRMKRVQEVLTNKVRDLHAMMEELENETKPSDMTTSPSVMDIMKSKAE